MSDGRPERFVIINTLVLAGSPADMADVGCAFTLLTWLARGPRGVTPDCQRMVCRLSKAQWKKRAPAILHVLDELIRNSEPRARIGRPPLSKGRREAIMARDGAVCRYCQTTQGPFHIDHIEPLARGGSNRDENLCVACQPCNFAKGASLYSEWNY